MADETKLAFCQSSMSNVTGQSEVKWCATAPDDIVWTGWNDEWVAFHRPSGRTHFLNAASKRLISEILLEPLDLPGILDEFGRVQDRNQQQLQSEEMFSMLERFDHLGLIDKL